MKSDGTLDLVDDLALTMNAFNPADTDLAQVQLDITAVGRVGVDDVDVELGVVEAGGEGKGRRGGRRRERKEEKEKGREGRHG